MEKHLNDENVGKIALVEQTNCFIVFIPLLL